MRSTSFLAALVGLCATQVFAQLPVRIVSFNIRYDNTDLSIADAEKYWLALSCAEEPAECRAPGVISLLGKCPAIT